MFEIQSPLALKVTVLEFKSFTDILKNGKKGYELSDSYRVSAITVLGVSVDYPPDFTEFDASPAIPAAFVAKASENDLQYLKQRLLVACRSYQVTRYCILLKLSCKRCCSPRSVTLPVNSSFRIVFKICSLSFFCTADFFFDCSGVHSELFMATFQA